MFAVTVSAEVLEADLAAGRMCCPRCDGPLSPWGFGRVRELRMLHDVRSVRPRRASPAPWPAMLQKMRPL